MIKNKHCEMCKYNKTENDNFIPFCEIEYCEKKEPQFILNISCKFFEVKQHAKRIQNGEDEDRVKENIKERLGEV